MPDFQPFAGIRYDETTAGASLGLLAAPPYDVIDEPERAGLEQAHPYNAVRLILPRDEQTEGDRYGRAARSFADWQDSGLLRHDAATRFYGYRMHFVGAGGEARHTSGVIGALTLPEAGDTDVLPHERTLSKARSDRLALLRATRANLDPIWALSPSDGLTSLLDESAIPLATCTDLDGVSHTLFAIDDPDRIAAIGEAVGREPLVLADGHHRFETACAYRQELREAGREVGAADAVMALVVELSDDELAIGPIHRLVTLADPPSVRPRLADAFDIMPLAPPGPVDGAALDTLLRRMEADGTLGYVDSEGMALLVPRPAISGPALAALPPAVAATDAALVEAVVVPRLEDAHWEYRHDATVLAALVDKGVATAALLLRPVTVAQTRQAALAGARMPQKTTFFHPKPLTGMVFRSFD